jgi:hypothetical protein
LESHHVDWRDSTTPQLSRAFKSYEDAETPRYSLDNPCEHKWASGQHADSADPPLRVSFFITNRRVTLYASVTAPSTVVASRTVTSGVMNRILPLTTRGTVISVHVLFVPIAMPGDEEFFL